MILNILYSVIGGIVGLIILFSSIFIVRQKSVAVIEVFGKFYCTKEPGLSLKFPWPIASIVGRVNMQIQLLSGNVGVKTKNDAFLNLPWSVQYKVKPDRVKEAFYELENPQKQMTSLILNTIRSKVTSMTMEKVYSSKKGIIKEVKKELDDKFSNYGYEILSVLIDEPMPSEEVQSSFNRVIAAKREEIAAKAEAEVRKFWW